MTPLRPLGLVLALLAAPPAGAAGLEGMGRITIDGGWRLTPNDFFYAKAAAAGFPVAHVSPGGPALMATFGYMVNEEFEVTIDAFASGEQLHLVGVPPLNSITYGGMIGGRYHLRLGDTFEAYGGLVVGPTLILAYGGPMPAGETSEAAVSGYLGSLGLSARMGDQWALSLEYRLLLGRGFVPGVGGLNGGGSWFGVGVTWYVASTEAHPSHGPAFGP